MKTIKVRKLLKNKKILFSISIILILASVLTALAITKPRIAVDFVTVSEAVPEEVIINSYTEDIKLDFEETHLAKFPNSLQLIADYRYSEEDFNEGEQEVLVQRYIDFFFFELISSQTEIVPVKVDRIAPPFEVTENVKSFYLLEDAKIKVKSEPGAKAFVSDEEIFTFGNEEEVVPVPTKDGNNKVEIVFIDEFKNKSEPQVIEFESFKKDNFKRASFDGISLPYNSELFSDAVEINLGLNMELKSSSAPCTNCGFFPDSLIIVKADFNNSVNDRINAVSNFSEVYVNEDRTLKSGVNGRYMEVLSTFEDTRFERHFIFEHNGIVYDFTSIENIRNSADSKLGNTYKISLDNLIIK